MSLLRNPEVRRGLLRWAAATAVLAGAAAVWEPRAGLAVLAAGAVFTALHLAGLRRRYRQMADLSRELDTMLHGAPADLGRFREGELAILRSQLAKLTARLQEQADALGRDKRFLADAMADLSHQLRTPLTSLNLVAEMLRADDLPPARRAELTRSLRGLLLQLEWQVEALLKLSRLDAGTAALAREKVAAAELIRRAAQPLAVAMELRGQTLTVRAGTEAFTGDPAWTAEALGNLLKNCSEHTPAGGEITVTARETAIFTEFTVTDTGPGFAPEDLPRLFERFYKGRGAAAGSIGIGLALARQIAAAQNGTLTAANGRHGGAVFTMRFYRGVV